MNLRVVFLVFILVFLAMFFTLFSLSNLLGIGSDISGNKLFLVLVALSLSGYSVTIFYNKFKKLKQENDFLNDLINTQDDIIVILNSDEIEHANTSFFKFFKKYKTLEEFNQEVIDIADLFIREDGFLTKSKYRNWIGHLSRYKDETHRVKLRRDDEVFTFKIIVNKLEEHDKVILTFIDVTEFENSRQLLDEYKKVVDVATIVSKTDLKGKITYVNDAFVKISGYKKEELLNKHHRILRSPNVPSSVFKDMWKTIKNKQVWMGEIENIAKNGMPYHVKATVIPILNVKGEVSEFIALRHDITEEIYSKKKALQRAKRTKDFLDDISLSMQEPIKNVTEIEDYLSSIELRPQEEKYYEYIKKDKINLEEINQKLKNFK